jgi:hypothetical protein
MLTHPPFKHKNYIRITHEFHMKQFNFTEKACKKPENPLHSKGSLRV